MKKYLTTGDRERLIWDVDIHPRNKLILLAYNSLVGSAESEWPEPQKIAEMTGYSIQEIESPGVQSVVQAWREGL